MELCSRSTSLHASTKGFTRSKQNNLPAILCLPILCPIPFYSAPLWIPSLVCKPNIRNKFHNIPNIPSQALSFRVGQHECDEFKSCEDWDKLDELSVLMFEVGNVFTT
jgi:hypothetical protein